MVITPQISGRLIVRFSVATAALMLLCQCETQRTYGEIRRGSIQFDQRMWGGQGGGSDEKEMRSKFAEKGYSISEDGSIVADNPDLFSDKKARGLDGKFGKKEAKFKNDVARTKEFRTPEYIKRQEYADVKSATDGSAVAREGNSNSSSDRQAGKLFQGRKSESSNQLASFDTGTARGTDQTFSTSSDEVGTAAIATAPRPVGVRQGAGYRANAGLSVDDVKKMLSPGVYAGRRGL